MNTNFKLDICCNHSVFNKFSVRLIKKERYIERKRGFSNYIKWISRFLSLISDTMSPISDAMSLINYILSLISDAMSLIDDAMSLIGDKQVSKWREVN